jgi:tetratricopeptide (TPR) repeat protein
VALPIVLRILGAAGWIAVVLPGLARAQDAAAERGTQFDAHYLPQVEALLAEGNHRAVAEVSAEAPRRSAAPWKWHVLRLRGLEGQGEWERIARELPEMTAAHPDAVDLAVEAHRLHLWLGETEPAARVLARANEAARQVPLRDRPAAELVALGRLAVALGADPDRVLRSFYGPAKAKDPKATEPWRAAGELALAKSDFARAAEEFRGGLKLAPRDPELRFGLARAFWPGDREEALAHAERVLEIQPVHAGALLLQAEHEVQAERYAEAEARLARLVEANPSHPSAWALRSAIALLRDGDATLARQAREQALRVRARHPEVPHLIGRCLSKRYRFAEGAAEQRLALEWDPAFLPARMQLAGDLLRLGDEEGAWACAEAVAAADPHHVLAYNYLQLRDQLAAYETRTTPHFVLRMAPREMAVYGDRALELLEEARARLTAKYGLELDRPTLVEFFEEQQDFAIRTFGELGGAGYLGVCFGTVITANSPGNASAGGNNWEATLWHEFCHVVTLTATRNRMPRWLSEGISVHEERLRDPTWGQSMSPVWRERVLRDGPGGLTPVGELSGAFLGASKPDDLLFAYFQSSLVVGFLAEEIGDAGVRGLLRRLADGAPVNDALAEACAMPLEALDERFVAHARALARAYGPDVDWTRPEDQEGTPRPDVKSRPRNFWIRQAHVLDRLEASDWTGAAESARALVALLPEYVGEDNGHELLARACRGAGDEAGEAAALREWMRRSAAAVAAGERLLELDRARADWPAVRETARRQMAVNPFLKSAHHCLACAAEETGRPGEAARAWETLLRLKPENPAEAHLRLGKLFAAEDPERARRHVLDALLEAPRSAEAHSLLAELRRRKGGEGSR